MYYGLGGTSFNWMMEAFFDKANLINPNQKHLLSRLWHAGAGTKLGIDYVTFNDMLPRLMYQTADTFYKHLKQGKTPVLGIGVKFNQTKPGEELDDEESMEAAVRLTNTLTGVLNTNEFGVEKDMLQLGLFSRSFTGSLFQQVSGATYPLWYNAVTKNTIMKSRYKTGLPGQLNWLMHGNTSDRIMKNIWKTFLFHLMVAVPTAKVLMLNFIQAGLTGMSDDEEWKKKVKANPQLALAMGNIEGKKLLVRIPPGLNWIGLNSTDHRGNQLYLDFLSWREAGQVYNLFGKLAGFKGSPGFQKTMDSKLSAFATMLRILFNYNPATGKKIRLETKHPIGPVNVKRTSKAIGQAWLPSPLKEGPKPPWSKFAASMAAPIRSGEEAGGPYSEEEKGILQWEQKKMADEDQLLKEEMYKIDLRTDKGIDQAIDLYFEKKGTITPVLDKIMQLSIPWYTEQQNTELRNRLYAEVRRREAKKEKAKRTKEWPKRWGSPSPR